MKENNDPTADAAAAAPEAIIELTEQVQPVPTDEGPIIALTDRIRPLPADDALIIELVDRVDRAPADAVVDGTAAAFSPPVVDVPPTAMASDEDINISAFQSRVETAGADDIDSALVFDAAATAMAPVTDNAPFGLDTEAPFAGAVAEAAPALDEDPSAAAQGPDDQPVETESVLTPPADAYDSEMEKALVFDDDMTDDFDDETDDFVDSLGMEIVPEAEPATAPPADVPAPEPLPVETPALFQVTDAAEAPALTAEKLEATLERVVEKVYAEKIEGILVEVIERVVTREIERIKALLTGDAEETDQ